LTEVHAPGTTLACDIEGSGPDMLLIHSGVADRRMWDPQWPWLTKSYRVVRYDQQGYGESPPGNGPVSPVRDALTVMDGAGMERAIVMGCAIGGETAVRLALAHPTRVRALVLIGTGLWGYTARLEGPVELDERDRAWRRGDYERALALDEKVWIVGVGRQAGQVDQAFLAFCRKMSRTRLRYADVHPTFTDDFHGEHSLGDLALPTLVVVGAEDLPHVLESGRHIVATVPDATLEIVPDAAHLVSLERPERFDSILRPWLASLED